LRLLSRGGDGRAGEGVGLVVAGREADFWWRLERTSRLRVSFRRAQRVGSGDGAWNAACGDSW
jgi:hypothetical protein